MLDRSICRTISCKPSLHVCRWAPAHQSWHKKPVARSSFNFSNSFPPQTLSCIQLWSWETFVDLLSKRKIQIFSSDDQTTGKSLALVNSFAHNSWMGAFSIIFFFLCFSFLFFYSSFSFLFFLSSPTICEVLDQQRRNLSDFLPFANHENRERWVCSWASIARKLQTEADRTEFALFYLFSNILRINLTNQMQNM